MSLRMRYSRDDSGAVAVVVAICSLVLLGMGALAVDIGQLYVARRESQRTADLAALAGAQALPTNPVQACTDAISYLDKNKPGGGDYGVSATTCGSSGTSDGSTVVISADALTIKVKVPDQTVNFGLAKVLGYSKGATTADATVQIRSPGHILPFALTLCKTDGAVTVKSSSGNTSSCTDSSQGDFGFLDIPRSGVNGSGNTLEANIDKGIDHAVDTLKPWPPPGAPSPTIAPNTKCGSIANSGVTIPVIDTGPTDGANCENTQTGNVASVITNGLIEHSNNACNGRLTRVRTGAVTSTVAGCTIDNDSFLTFLTGGTAAQAAAGTLPDGAISQDIINSPNFFVVPVINANQHPQNGAYPIVDFRGFYLECFDGQNAGPCTDASQAATGQIKELFGYAFKLDGIGGVSADDGDTNIYYGGGVRVPVLIK